MGTVSARQGEGWTRTDRIVRAGEVELACGGEWAAISSPASPSRMLPARRGGGVLIPFLDFGWPPPDPATGLT